eukprot:COSAG02_NODE_15308_length_1182_cov_2.009234_1_plen_76_part_00
MGGISILPPAALLARANQHKTGWLSDLPLSRGRAPHGGERERLHSAPQERPPTIDHIGRLRAEGLLTYRGGPYSL